MTNPNIGSRAPTHDISTWACWRDATHSVAASKYGWPQCTVCMAAPPYHERPEWLPDNFMLGIYLPSRDEAGWKANAIISTRSAIVGLPVGYEQRWIDAYFEGWLNGPMQYRDRDARGLWEAGIFHAASRMVTNYPTIACAHLPTEALTCIGNYRPKERHLHIDSEGIVALDEWLKG
jgi:hypothetical protein